MAGDVPMWGGGGECVGKPPFWVNAEWGVERDRRGRWGGIH